MLVKSLYNYRKIYINTNKSLFSSSIEKVTELEQFVWKIFEEFKYT